jgi:hypothetical protein
MGYICTSHDREQWRTIVEKATRKVHQGQYCQMRKKKKKEEDEKKKKD